MHATKSCCRAENPCSGSSPARGLVAATNAATLIRAKKFPVTDPIGARVSFLHYYVIDIRLG